jgi:hypothetical protein
MLEEMRTTSRDSLSCTQSSRYYDAEVILGVDSEGQRLFGT